MLPEQRTIAQIQTCLGYTLCGDDDHADSLDDVAAGGSSREASPQYAVPPEAAGNGREGALPRGVRVDGVESSAPRRAVAPRRGRARDPGDHRRRARLRPWTPRRSPRRARAERLRRASPRSWRSSASSRSLTPAGGEALLELRAIAKRVEKEFLAPLDADERRTLHALLLELARCHDLRCAGARITAARPAKSA